MVVSEQGFGDQLLFSRVLAQAIPVAYKIGYCSSKEMLPLFQHNYPEIEYMVNEDFVKDEAAEAIYDEYDYIMTIGDLFRAYVLEFGELPPLVKLESDYVMKPEENSIGYVYSAGNQGDNGHLRTIPENTIKFLSKHNYIYNFQMGMKTTLGHPVGQHITNFMDTARLLDGVSHVVTVDTSFAHLALAMGKPTMIVHNKFLDWRWKCDLYPEAKLLSVRDPKFQEKMKLFVGS